MEVHESIPAFTEPLTSDVKARVITISLAAEIEYMGFSFVLLLSVHRQRTWRYEVAPFEEKASEIPNGLVATNTNEPTALAAIVTPKVAGAH